MLLLILRVISAMFYPFFWIVDRIVNRGNEGAPGMMSRVIVYVIAVALLIYGIYLVYNGREIQHQILPPLNSMDLFSMTGL